MNEEAINAGTAGVSRGDRLDIPWTQSLSKHLEESLLGTVSMMLVVFETKNASFPRRAHGPLSATSTLRAFDL